MLLNETGEPNVQKLQGEQGRGGVPLKQPHLHKAQGRGGENVEARRQEMVQIVIV